MRKIITALLTLVLVSMPAYADSIEKMLSKQHINHGIVSISIKDAKTGQKVYSLNDKTPRQPASTLKVITTSASVNTLGKDYQFTTSLYKSTNNDLYLKLGADPFLKSGDLKQLISTAKSKNIAPKTFYIDNTIFDSTEWGEGWQWDDELNPYMPKFSAYNLDGNLIDIEITPQKNAAPLIAIKPFYPINIMNLIKNGDYTNIVFERNNIIAPNIISAKGFITKPRVFKIPALNQQLYFNLRLEEAIRNRKLEYYNPLKIAKLPEENIYLVDRITNDIEPALKQTLKSSNNLIAETLFKLAGAKYSQSTGSAQNSYAMLENYFEKLNLNSEDIKIVDGSGVSKNNLMTADFMTEFLVKLYNSEDFEVIEQCIPTPGEGTLKNRMLYFKDNMRAKTGTLSDTSAITGYITTRRGKIYVFNIMIQDAKTSEADKKNIEEQILRQVYMMN